MGMNIQQPTTHFWDIVVVITLENKTHVQMEVSHLSLATPNNEWIFLLLETIFIF